MNTQKKVSLSEIEKSLESGELRNSQIIQFVLGMGVFILGLVSLIYYIVGEVDASSINKEIIKILIIINFTLLIFSYWISKLIYESYFTNNFLSILTQNKNPEPIDNWLGRIKTAEIIRSAMREGAALFGLVICILAISNNVIQDNSEYWINSIPAIVFIGHIYINFPTKDKYISLYQNKILNY